MKLCRADITSKNHNKVKKYLHNFDVVDRKLKEVEEKDKLRNFQPPISGEDIMKVYDLKPSKEVGELKKAIREAILDGEISNDFQEAYHYLLKKGEQLGLNIVQRLTP